MGALPVVLGALLLVPGETRAEDAKPIPVVAYNADLNAFEHVLPHRTEFTIRIIRTGFDAEFNGITASFSPQEGTSCPKIRPEGAKPLAAAAGELDADGKRKYSIQVPRLTYSSSYCFWFEFQRTWSDLDAKATGDAQTKTVAKQVGEGLFSDPRTKELLEKYLGDRGKLLVSIKGTKSSQSLLELVNTEVAPKIVPMGEAWLNYYEERLNAISNAREVMVYDPRNRATTLFKAPIPLPVVALDASWTEFVSAAKAAKYDKELSESEKEQAREREPATLTVDELTLRQKAQNLAEAAKAVHNDVSLCGTLTPASPPALNDYCKKKVEPIEGYAGKVRDKLAPAGPNSLVALQKSFEKQKKETVEAVKKVVDTISGAEATVTPTSTPLPSYTERSMFYVSADVGGVVPIFWRIFDGTTGGAAVAPYFGVSINFVPVDKDVPLAEEGGFWKRTSVTAGITLTPVNDSSGTTKGAADGNGILVGVGVRATDYWRLGFGGMLVTQKDANPVVNDTHLRVVPYLSTSIDIDVAGTIKAAYSSYVK